MALREPRKELVEAIARGREERMESEAPTSYAESPQTESYNPVTSERIGAGRLTRESAEWNYDSSETFERKIEPRIQNNERRDDWPMAQL